MDLEGIILSEMSQIEKDKDLTYIENLKKKTTKIHRNREKWFPGVRE